MKAKPKFDFVAQAPNQINLRRGLLYVVTHNGGNGGWSKAIDPTTGKEGFFPTDYVDFENDSALPNMSQTAMMMSQNTIPVQINMSQPSVPGGIIKAKVKFHFPGTNPGEMNLNAGEVIDIMFRGPPGGWSKGGRGSFPTDYVEFLPSQTLPTAMHTDTNPLTNMQSSYKPPAPMNTANTGGLDLLGMGSPVINKPSTVQPSPMQPPASKGGIDLLSLDMPSTIPRSTGNDFLGLSHQPPLSTSTTMSSPFDLLSTNQSSAPAMKPFNSTGSGNMDLLSMNVVSTSSLNIISTNKNIDLLSMDSPKSITKTTIPATFSTMASTNKFDAFDAFTEAEKDLTPSLLVPPTTSTLSVSTTNPTPSKPERFIQSSSSSSGLGSVTADTTASTSTAKTQPSSSSSIFSVFGFNTTTSSTETVVSTVPLASDGSSNNSNSLQPPFKPPKTTSSIANLNTNISSTHTNINNMNSNSLPLPPPLSQQPQKFAQAKFDRESQGSTELSIKKGDILFVDKQDKEWWLGSVYISSSSPYDPPIQPFASGTKKGYFPGNFVKLLEETDATQLAFIAAGATNASTATNNVVTKGGNQSISAHTSSQVVLPTRTGRAIVGAGSRSSVLKLPSGAKKDKILALDGVNYSLDAMDKGHTAGPVWHHTFFFDLFCDAFKYKLITKDPIVKSPVSVRMKYAYYILRSALMKVRMEEEDSDSVKAVIHHVLKIIGEAVSMCDKFPHKGHDAGRFFNFLCICVGRIRTLAENESTMFPATWLMDENDEDSEHGVTVIVTKTSDGDDQYSVCIVNSSMENGLEYHVAGVDNADGSILRNTALELCNVPGDRVTNAAFWFIACKCHAYSGYKSACAFFYERVLTYLTSTSIASSVKNAMANNQGTFDFRPVSLSGDYSFINNALESLRFLSRTAGLDDMEADQLLMHIRSVVITFVQNDLHIVKNMNPFEADLIRAALRAAALSVGTQASSAAPTVNTTQLKQFKSMVTQVEQLVEELCPKKRTLPMFECISDQTLSGICDWTLLERFKRDDGLDIEALAGAAPTPPIIRPVELTLVPEVVNNFNEVAIAMRHTLHLCVLLANQKEYIRNSYTLRLCLINHLFTRVIPLPLPVTHKDREKRCFWHSQTIRFETQSDILKLLNMICRHFATCSLSVKMTRSGDAIRILTFSCMATVCDAILRKIAIDIPSQTSLHYAGKAAGPGLPFGFQLGNFAEESEYLKFISPELTCARTQILDYFHELKTIVTEDHVLFTFESGSNQFNSADSQFINQIAIQMGFDKNCVNLYMSGADPILIDHYPELGYFRDLLFMMKLVMVPTSDKLPELKPWLVNDSALKWTYEASADTFGVIGFGGMKLDCKSDLSGTGAVSATEGGTTGTGNTTEELHVQQAISKVSFWSRIKQYMGIKQKQLRSMPSQANPSVLLSERVDTEDDILHVRDLPDFDGTLGAKDCEVMLQYLTAPYMRIPLLLNFFSSELRLKALRNNQLQEVLDASLFEPGQWKNRDQIDTPSVVPAPTRRHLHTSAGLLFNEILNSPNVILTTIYTMLEKVVDMDTGKYSELGSAILYVTRLAVKVEGFLLFLIRNYQFHNNPDKNNKSLYNGAYQDAYVRGLDDCDISLIEEVSECQKKLRAILDEKMFKIIARWIKVSKKDGLCKQACMLHAHLAYLHRNMEIEDITPKIAFAALASQIYLFNNYKYDLDVEVDKSLNAGDATTTTAPEKSYKEDKHKNSRKEAEVFNMDLVIPQVELFDMFQRNRSKLLQWLIQYPEHRNTVMDSILQLVEEGQATKSFDGQEKTRKIQKWVSIEKSGLNFRGRFIPDTDYSALQARQNSLSAEADVNYEVWLRETTTLAVNTEVNVQLGEFTIKKNAARPLDDEFKKWRDFSGVFGKLTENIIIQCAEVKNTTNRKWVRLPGLNYDLQLWRPDRRNPTHTFSKPFENCGCTWLKELITPWSNIAFKTTTLFMPGEDLSNASVTMLAGYHDVSTEADPDKPDTLREVVIYRYPRLFHIYNIVEYGRRWYRQMIFSSDASLCLHEMREQTLVVDETSCICSGDPTIASNKNFSLIIHRDYLSGDTAETVSAAAAVVSGGSTPRTTRTTLRQTYVPERFLHGLIPSGLLKLYKFRQNEDDSLTAYMPAAAVKTTQRSILKINFTEKYNDSKYFKKLIPTAIIARTFILEDQHSTSVAAATATATATAAADGPLAVDPEFIETPDTSKPPLYLINLLTLLNSYGTKHALWKAIDHSNLAQTSVDPLLEFSGEHLTLHALIRMLLRLDNLANIIAWSKTAPSTSSSNTNETLSIDLIELPRLRLTFEKVIDVNDKTIRYYCVEQTGLFLTGYNEKLQFSSLIDSIPKIVLLKNVDHEYFALIPATAKPRQVKMRGSKNTYHISFLASDEVWLYYTGEQTYFVYGIHPSGCFMSARSVGASLYLLLLRLMARQYDQAFRLIETCVTDVFLSPQEKQIYDLIATVKDDFSPDLHACRLKLYFVTYGSEIMPYQFDRDEEMCAYVSKYKYVSANCRLSSDEEYFILSKISDTSPMKTLSMVNRERLIMASFTLPFQVANFNDNNASDSHDIFNAPPTPNGQFAPVYPKVKSCPDDPNLTPVDLNSLDTNIPSFKTFLSKLAIIKYSRPEAMTGPQTIAYLTQLFEEQKNMGFFFLYELMNNQSSITIIPDDSSFGIGSVLFRMLPADFVGGVQNTILRVMDLHPQLCAQMPVFEDKRTLKIPTFAGLDIFQSHVQKCAAFIKTQAANLDMQRLACPQPPPYMGPMILQVAFMMSTNPNASDINIRRWIVHRVLDYNCPRRILSLKNIPRELTRVSTTHFTSEALQTLAVSPLLTSQLAPSISVKTHQERGEPSVDSRSHLTVLQHPLSRSHIARTGLARLEQDINHFASAEAAALTPVLDLTALIQATNINEALTKIKSIITHLEKTRESDIVTLKAGIKELFIFCNAENAFSTTDFYALKHNLLRYAGAEADLEFDFLAAVCSSDKGTTGAYGFMSSFLPAEEVDGLFSFTMILMMISCRVSLTNLALNQSRSLLKLIQNLLSPSIASASRDRTTKESLSLIDTLAVTLNSKRHYLRQVADGFELDPRFLLFEFCHGLLLRDSQVELVHKLVQKMKEGQSICHQMIMGQGKTTVVAPLLAMILANAETVVMEVVPPALLDFSTGVLRERFVSAIRKPVFTFNFDRYHPVRPQMLYKLETARSLRAVVVAAPSSIKSFMLKFLEICHILNRHKHMSEELKQHIQIDWGLKIRHLLGLGIRTAGSTKRLSDEEIQDLKLQANICVDIFKILKKSIEIMDEIDILLHPLKSELNWPLGHKEPLDFTRSRLENGLRWSVPSHLLDAIFCCCGMPILADVADSRVAKGILNELETAINQGFTTLAMQKSPHLVLISKHFYEMQLKPILARWMILWLRARKLSNLEDADIVKYLLFGGTNDTQLSNKVHSVLSDDHIKMLNLCHDWLDSFLPFVLQKINRVNFGLLHPNDLELLMNDGVKIPTSRKLTAVPFVAKDVPSRGSEFAHPDILIGLTILAYRYEGLRENDFIVMMKFLKESMESEGGIHFKDRPSCQRFETWILSAGRAIRGSKKVLKGRRKIDSSHASHMIASVNSSSTAASAASSSINLTQLVSVNGNGSTAGGVHSLLDLDQASTVTTTTTTTTTATKNVNIFAEIFSEDFDDLIWPLQYVDPKDSEQFRVLFPLLFKLPHPIMFYLNELIFPEVLAHQGLKISTCGQELGGDMLFGRRIGFSGTPSDILPRELGSCHYEKGSDGKVVHYLTSVDVVHHIDISPGWSVKTILDTIATSVNPPFSALIDTGALITGLSNKEVADYLLSAGLTNMKGVVYLDELDRQMVLLRKGRKVVKLSESGLGWGERFTFYDQVHTTGMDIKQAVDACAALTLGKDMVFRDYAQGAFRMRGIGKGQTICLFVVPEIEERIRVQVSTGSGRRVDRFAVNKDQQAFLRNVLSWLVINSMKVDGVQFDLLCEQNACNVWRKVAFNNLCKEYRQIDTKDISPKLAACLQVFRERVDFVIENSVPQSVRYSEKISKLINANSNLLQSNAGDKDEAMSILELIRNEEARNEELKNKARAAISTNSTAGGGGGGAVNLIDFDIITDDSNIEQSFNREQVQQQEQEEEAEKEQEKEKEKEEERVDELEDEEFTRQKYARDDETPIPWNIEELSKEMPVTPIQSSTQQQPYIAMPSSNAKHAKLNFYQMSTFCIFKNAVRANETLNFPEFLYVSKNHFQLEWVLRRTARRIKNVIIVLEWNPIANAGLATAKSSQKTNSSYGYGNPFNNSSSMLVNLTSDQEIALKRAFDMFDVKKTGRLGAEELKRATNNLGFDASSVDEMVSQKARMTATAASGGSAGSTLLSVMSVTEVAYTYEMFKELVQSLISQFKDTDGRYYCLLSLDEAEHLRGIMHGRKRQSLLPSEAASLDCTSAVLWALNDNDFTNICASRNTKKLSPAHHASMVNSYRFLNCETYFNDHGITVLLRILEKNKCDEREKWWSSIRACRRRRQIALDGSNSVTSIFVTTTEFQFMQFKSEIARIQFELRDRGLLIYDAFRLFNSSNSGLMNCSELYGGLDFLGIPFSPDQVYSLVRKVAVDNEGLVSYNDFKRALQFSDQDFESSHSTNGGGAFEPIAPHKIPEIFDSVSKAVTETKLTINEELLSSYKVKVIEISSFVSVWNSLGTQSQSTVSIWAPSIQQAYLNSTATVCLGHYVSDNVYNPSRSSFSKIRCQVIELKDSQTLRYSKSKVLESVLSVIMPYPVRFKHVWHLAREKKGMYVWKPVAPDGYVALGVICTDSDAPPEVSCIRCVPMQWCAPSKFNPVKIWDDTGAGGGKPGSIWIVNNMGMFAVNTGPDRPVDTFYEIQNKKFFIDPQQFLKK